MNYSTNYNLNMPERNEQFNLDHWNANTKVIDTTMKANENKSVDNANRATALERCVTASNKATDIANTSSQLYKLMKAIYPVGSLYWSSKNTNPSTLFGGTWTQIKDKFVLACGDTYPTTGATGGNASIKLTVANLPSHSHTFTPSGTVKSTFTGTSHSHTFTPSGSISNTTAGGNVISDGIHKHTLNDPGHKHKIPGFWSSFAGGDYNVLHEGGIGSLTTNVVTTGITMDSAGSHTHQFHGSPHSHTFTGTEQTIKATQGGTVASTFTGTSSSTGSVGSATAINILPPYIVKYCWERTA